MKLCFCNICENIYEDPNPGADSKEYSDAIPVQSLTFQTDEDGDFWGCPECGTDSFLVDNVPESFLDHL
jgi:rubredoxin